MAIFLKAEPPGLLFNDVWRLGGVWEVGPCYSCINNNPCNDQICVSFLTRGRHPHLIWIGTGILDPSTKPRTLNKSEVLRDAITPRITEAL